MNQSLRIRLITTLSATLEFYDFTLLIFLAPVMAKTFFPEQSGVGDVMPVLMLFFAGYLARFFGGMLFSHGGDTRGRKRYYLWSIVVMSLSTLGIALLPGQSHWGVLAPVCLLVLRIFQGLSLGGEIPGAVVFAAEHCPVNRRGQVTGLIISGVTFGNVLATGTVSLLYSAFGETAVYDWAWRLAFVAGSGLGLISFWLRLALDETPAFRRLELPEKESWPSRALCRNHGLELLRGTCLAAVPAVAISVLFFMPRFQQQYLGFAAETVFSMSFQAFLFLTLVTLLMAVVSDRTGRLPLIRWGALLMAVGGTLGVYFLVNRQLTPWNAMLPLLLATAMIMGVYEAAMVELFPTGIRYSGVAFCHNLAFSLFGGLTPMLLEWFCRMGVLVAPGLLPGLTSLCLLLLALGWKDRYAIALGNIQTPK
ncbi:MAG: MFS transporter [Endozoicomonas sp.]